MRRRLRRLWLHRPWHLDFGEAIRFGVAADQNADFRRHPWILDGILRKHYMEPIRAMLNEPSPLLAMLERRGSEAA